jgi:hypothetical protein
VENSFGQEAIFKKGGRIDREANMNGKANPHRNNGSDPHNWAEAFSMPQRRNGYGKAQAPPAGFQPPRQMESSMQAVPVMQMGQQGTRDEPMWVQLPTKEAQQDANMMMPRPQQHRNVAQPADTMHGTGMAAPTFPIYRNNQNMPHGQQADIGAQNAQKEAEMMARLVFGGCGSQGEEQSDYFDNMHGMENADPDEGEDNGYGTSWMNLERIQTDESLCFHIRHNYEQEHHDTDSEVENIRGPIDFNMRMAPQDFAAAPHMHGQRVHAVSDQMLGPSLHGTRAHVQSQGVRAGDAPHPSHQTTSPSIPRRRGLKPAPLKLDRFQTPNHAQSGFCPPSGIAETEEEHRQSFVSEDMTAGRSCHDTEEGQSSYTSFGRGDEDRHSRTANRNFSSFMSFEPSSEGRPSFGSNDGDPRNRRSFNRPSWADEDPNECGDTTDITPLFSCGDVSPKSPNNQQRLKIPSQGGNSSASLERFDV